MVERGIFKMLLPKSIGGGELDPLTYTAVLEILDTALQTDGKIVLAGRKGAFAAVARLNIDGSLDTTFGNGGLFSITGRFWNRKLGRYRALATDPSRAIVLRYPKRTIVITPHDPQHFIMRARTFLKVADFPK